MKCPICKKADIIQNEKGRRRKYCSDECKFEAHNRARRQSGKSKCKRHECKFMIVHGKRGRYKEYCSERCKRLAYRWQEG